MKSEIPSTTGRFIYWLSPRLYRSVNGIWGRLLAFFVNKGPFITDNLGGSFKDYLAKNNLNGLKSELYKGLDGVSLKQLDVVIQRIQKLPDYTEFLRTSKKYRFLNNKSRMDELLDLETKQGRRQIELELKGVNNNTVGFAHEPSVGVFCHGLTLVPKAVQDNLRGQEFIDIGSYIGDSAISLHKFGFRRIHSFDISLSSIDQYKKNLALNGIDTEMYKINHKVVGSQSGQLVSITDSGSPGLSVNRYAGRGAKIEVGTITIDDYCSQNNLQPALIKADMEGFAFEFVKGAINTIEKCRPVLLIAIYHNPIEFFELKPFLEKKLGNYNFIIRKLSPGINRNECHSEVFLIGYPKELS